MSAYIYLEGGRTGAGSKDLNIRCQEGFHKLLDRMGFKGRKPRLVACGGRGAVYDRFVIEHSAEGARYVAMWIDSEEPMINREAAWEHLRKVRTVPQWERPEGAEDDQVLLMTTCMETWIVADRAVLREHYGSDLQESALPSLVELENRERHDVQAKLEHATRNCTNAYGKGKRSFEILGQLTADVLKEFLPSFVRVRRILNQKL
ncbi:MAG: DUF4276 family protein [Limisphaerales bacterium]